MTLEYIGVELYKEVRIIEIRHSFADIFVAIDGYSAADYFYGGTRIVNPDTNINNVRTLLYRLMKYESKVKNNLINITLRKNVLSSYADQLPKGFLESTVGGARCIIRPKNHQIASILERPNEPQFISIIAELFKSIGQVLNKEDGKIKLTPDFGRFADLADYLACYTPHVLGVRCEDGGCGGKSSYTTSGIIAVFEQMEKSKEKDENITLIGSAGELGSEMLNYLVQQEFKKIAVCDLAYDTSSSTFPEMAALPNLTMLPSQNGRFTNACLKRGGIILATTIGRELENSNWQIIPPGTVLLLAHNLALPEYEEGVALVRSLAKQKVLVIPGQLMTLGGALTSRIEWFWRKANPGSTFNKSLAHSVVKEVVKFWMGELTYASDKSGMTLYEEMLSYADMDNY